jgi:hypothetical protein
MLDFFNTASPQSANYQEFFGPYRTRNSNYFNWIKPRGVSMVRIMLIGAGGGGYSNTNGGNGGGGSGGITQWIGPAMFIPDILTIQLSGGGPSGNPGNYSYVYWEGPTPSASPYYLLTANFGASSSTGGAAGAAAANTPFGASGIYKSTAGQAGFTINASTTRSTTTFLSGGAGGSSTNGGTGGTANADYGYPSVAGSTGPVVGNDGYFISKPLMGVGGSGAGGGSSNNAKYGGVGGYGCGGGGAGNSLGADTRGSGGPAACFIWSW